jgi:hypothetical protein
MTGESGERGVASELSLNHMVQGLSPTTEVVYLSLHGREIIQVEDPARGGGVGDNKKEDVSSFFHPPFYSLP